MKPLEAGKLLGGHAAGILTPEERQHLFEAALDHQELFDALADEEALRELLADPGAREQLLAALGEPVAPRVVPFWRRSGVLGTAAGLLMAATAGLVVLRSPDKAPPPLERSPAQAAPDEPLPRAVAPLPPPPGPAGAQGPAAPSRGMQPARERRDASSSAVPAPVEAGPAPAESRRAEDHLAEKAKAGAAAAPVAARQEAPSGLLIGGVVGGIRAKTQGPAPGAPQQPAPPPPPAPAKSARRVEWKAAAAYAPGWTLEAQPDGSTRVRLKGPEGAQAVLLRRTAGRVEVLPLVLVDTAGGMTRWTGEVRLRPGDALDFYLLNAPVDDPAHLPETGSVDGYRVRIHPPAAPVE